MNSCPAIQEEVVGTVRIRCNGGYTKRGNSANILTIQSAQEYSLVDTVERFYEMKKQTPIFRLVQHEGVATMDELLAHRGYEYIEPSLVMARELDSVNPAIVSHATRFELDEWLGHFYAISNDSDAFKSTHAQMLNDTPAENFLAAVCNAQGAVVSMGIGLVLDGYLGIFNMVTRPEMRRQGFASQLIRLLTAWGMSRRAHTAYLQVRQDNSAAVGVYKQHGFEVCHRYWYRILNHSNKTKWSEE